MLPVILHNDPGEKFESYDQAITHLASNTVVFYSGQQCRPNGNDLPSYDIGQVCCWLSEQPLRNGMRLCTINNGSNKIAAIDEPIPDVPGEIALQHELPVMNPYDLLLISPDCYEGFKNSLEYFKKADTENVAQRLIKNPFNPNEYVKDPLNFGYYIWPNYMAGYRDQGEQQYVLINLNTLSTFKPDPGYRFFSSQDCFIYSRKTALVQQLVTKVIDDDDDDTTDGDDDSNYGNVVAAERFIVEVGSEDLKEFLFIEANPALPDPLYVMAENTIRLFQLNGLYYHYLNNTNIHCVTYSAGESIYDDMRPEGHLQAYKRADVSLQQRKIMQNMAVDQETMQVFNSQYKILMELTGYSSVWATVFNEGGDPGGFNDIMGIPAPVAPVAPVAPRPIKTTKKRNVLNLKTQEHLSDVLQKAIDNVLAMPEFAGEQQNAIINNKRLRSNVDEQGRKPENYEPVTKKARTDDLPGQALDTLTVVGEITTGVLPCSAEFMNQLNMQIEENNTVCYYDFGLSV